MAKLIKVEMTLTEDEKTFMREVFWQMDREFSAYRESRKRTITLEEGDRFLFQSIRNKFLEGETVLESQ